MEVKEVEQLAEEYGADVMRFCKKLTDARRMRRIYISRALKRCSCG